MPSFMPSLKSNPVAQFSAISIGRLLAVILAIALLATSASAQFTSLDQKQVSTNLGGSFGVVIVDNPNSDLDAVGDIDIHGELALGNWGLYSAFPIMFTLDGSPQETAVGNLEIGGTHRRDLDGPFSLISYLGVVFPTASDDPDKTEVRLVGSTAQLGDYYIRSAPDLWAVRVGTSPRLDSKIFFAQADLGLDFLFPKNSGNDVGLLTSVGVGARVAIVTGTIEVANAGLLTVKDSFNQTLSFGLSLKMLILSPHVTYTMSLNDRFGSDNYQIAFGASVGF
jgi:hypothetical protein